MQTAMSRSLPLELLDCIVDDLRDDPTALKACCVVAKSWVPRTQSHLFARVRFDTRKHSVEEWMKIFPDPSNSPARHTRSLSIRGLPVVTSPDVDIGGWIRSFRNLVRLHLRNFTWEDHEAPLVPFHGLSPTVRSLRLTSTSFEVFDLICSFPLLEDLTLTSILPESGDAERTGRLVSSPKLTGSLGLNVRGGIGIPFIVRRLLDLPNGLHFVKISVSCRDEEDTRLATELVSRCSGTLESLTIRHLRAFPSPSMIGLDLTTVVNVGLTGLHFLDLSKATKLKDLTFRTRRSTIKSITMTLQTIGSKNLQQITIHPCVIGAKLCQGWRDLDIMLVQLWTLHSIRPRLMYGPDGTGKDARDCASSLLPELTRREILHLVKRVPL